ncbi:hypothetical protein FRB91_005248 [Serendipita sp. 411]|nr:hypothetical protein FRC18_006133 [Serendipita sp. 400]KAG8853213.1 hypothetical protein FRB91_005248 [Serendipita sp. 411]
MSMGLLDTFHFDAADYEYKKSREPTRTLIKKHHSKVRELTAHGVTAGAGIALMPLTLGISLGSAAYAARQAYVILQQKELIEAELSRRRVCIPRMRKRDVATGGSIGAAGAAISVLLPVGIHEITGDLGGATAGYAFPSSHPDPVTALANNEPPYPGWDDLAYGISSDPQTATYILCHHDAPPSMGGSAPVPLHFPSAAEAHGFAHGAAAAFSSQGHHLAHMFGSHTLYAAPNAPNPPGFAMGVNAVGEAESFGIGAAAGAALGAGGKRIVR